MLLIALLAVLLPLILLAGLNFPAAKGMAISAGVVLVTAAIFWKMSGLVLLASMLQGLHKTLPILWILFGALLMLEVLKKTGAIQRINQGFMQVTTDRRVLTILIVYLFGGLIEGVSGFGTPAMVTAPLMLALGFNPLAAVTLALVVDSTSASFGAVGTPLTVGLSNLPGGASYIQLIGQMITRVELTAGTFVPTLIIWILIKFFGSKTNETGKFKEMLPWSLALGFSYSLVAFITVHLIGYEFASIVTPLVVLGLTLLSIRMHWLLPASVYKNAWGTSVDSVHNNDKSASSMPLWLAWLPYLLVVILLLVTRTVEPIRYLLDQYLDLSWVQILGFNDINSSWQFLSSPGTILTVAAVIGLAFQQRTLKPLIGSAKSVLQGMKLTGFTLAVTLMMVQIFSNSGLNQGDLASMPTYIAKSIAEILAPVWPFVAPLLGELGSFITGSATVSTLTFAPIQANVAQQAGLNGQLIMALQVIGAAAGNMICVHNIVAASAVVGLSGKEGQILRRTAIPALVYWLLLGLTGAIWLIFI
ncbi:L-lactate permease [Weissella koreensis]|uniref:L-lactate permease n=1 Tax=Weissella koreensis TaxID=165096 RepID=UPI000CF34249|nr:L-lactate permease [Weissella koreensis]AVH75367.1 lactate permease [Weissella koreensis]